MSARKIAQFEGVAPNGAARVVRVYFESDFREYVCRPNDADRNPGDRRTAHPATYFTDDKADAIATARAMCGETLA